MFVSFFKTILINVFFKFYLIFFKNNKKLNKFINKNYEIYKNSKYIKIFFKNLKNNDLNNLNVLIKNFYFTKSKNLFNNYFNNLKNNYNNNFDFYKLIEQKKKISNVVLTKNYNYKNSFLLFCKNNNKNILNIFSINNKKIFKNNFNFSIISLFLEFFSVFILIFIQILFYFENNIDKHNSKENECLDLEKNNKFNEYFKKFLKYYCNMSNKNYLISPNFIKIETISKYYINYLPLNVYKNTCKFNVVNFYNNNLNFNNLNFNNLNYNYLNFKKNNLQKKIKFNIFFCKLFFKILNFEKKYFFSNNKVYSFSDIIWNNIYLDENNNKINISKIEQYNNNKITIKKLYCDFINPSFLEDKIFKLNNITKTHDHDIFNVSFEKKFKLINLNFSEKIYSNLLNISDSSYFEKNLLFVLFYENISLKENIFKYFLKLNKKFYLDFIKFIVKKNKKNLINFFYKNNFFFYKNINLYNILNDSFFIKGLSITDKEYYFNMFFFKNEFKKFNFYLDKQYFFKNELKKFNFNYLNFFLTYNKYKNDLLDYNFIRFDERFKKHFFKISYKTSNQNLILANLFIYDFKLKKYYNTVLDYYVNNAKPTILVFYDFFKKLIIPLFIFMYILISLILLGYLPFNKILFAWIISIMSFYWLMSGFVFFVKKYQYSNFTAAIQRFWKRSYIIFWLLEIFVFLIFMYLTLNANQESFYMFDNIQFFKTKLYSWRSFIFKLYPVTFLLILSNIFILALRWTIFSKLSIWLIIFSGGLLYVFWFEFYQFMFISTFHTNFDWIFDFDEYKWEADIDEFKTRNINNFVVLLIVLKFWHIVFIIFFWLFFILRSLELTKVTYTLFSANSQNMLILYIFSWILMYPWFKYTFRHFLDMPYKWFYVNNRNLFNRVFFYDLNVFYKGILDKIIYFNFDYKFNFNKFFYLNSVSKNFNYSSFRKDYITNSVIKSLINIK